MGSSGLGAFLKADMACHQESSPHPPNKPFCLWISIPVSPPQRAPLISHTPPAQPLCPLPYLT